MTEEFTQAIAAFGARRMSMADRLNTALTALERTDAYKSGDFYVRFAAGNIRSLLEDVKDAHMYREKLSLFEEVPVTDEMVHRSMKRMYVGLGKEGKQ